MSFQLSEPPSMSLFCLSQVLLSHITSTPLTALIFQKVVNQALIVSQNPPIKINYHRLSDATPDSLSEAFFVLCGVISYHRPPFPCLGEWLAPIMRPTVKAGLERYSPNERGVLRSPFENISTHTSPGCLSVPQYRQLVSLATLRL